ncbi:ubc11p, putative [Babesia ovis]|uniref:Ubc11p, putative n=1 Tax=Babesia ovis TaxID=5869 RepID=A0A9W5WVK1_BABOV|nr:ubc11p, putative [Babesia ovis]
MSVSRAEEVWHLKRKYIRLESKGPFSTSYKLPIDTAAGCSNTTLEIRVPLSYPDKPLQLKIVKPVPHPWADADGNITLPHEVQEMRAVDIVEAVLAQFEIMRNNKRQIYAVSQVNITGGSGNVVPSDTWVGAHNDSQTGSTSYMSPSRVMYASSAGAYDNRSSRAVAVGTSDLDDTYTEGGSVSISHVPKQRNYDEEIDEMVLKACFNPPNGTLTMLKEADKDEVSSIFTNEDLRWKALKQTPQMSRIMSEMTRLTKANEKSSLAIIAAVNKQQELLESIAQKQTLLESMGIDTRGVDKVMNDLRKSYKTRSNAEIQQLKKQIAAKCKAIQDGTERIEDCFEALLAMHRKCNELATVQIALFS